MQYISRRVREGIVIGEETQITVQEINEEEKSVTLCIHDSTGSSRYRVVTLTLPSDDDGDASCEFDSQKEFAEPALLSTILA